MLPACIYDHRLICFFVSISDDCIRSVTVTFIFSDHAFIHLELKKNNLAVLWKPSLFLSLSSQIQLSCMQVWITLIVFPRKVPVSPMPCHNAILWYLKWLINIHNSIALRSTVSWLSDEAPKSKQLIRQLERASISFITRSSTKKLFL